MGAPSAVSNSRRADSAGLWPRRRGHRIEARRGLQRGVPDSPQGAALPVEERGGRGVRTQGPRVRGLQLERAEGRGGGVTEIAGQDWRGGISVGVPGHRVPQGGRRRAVDRCGRRRRRWVWIARTEREGFFREWGLFREGRRPGAGAHRSRQTRRQRRRARRLPRRAPRRHLRVRLDPRRRRLAHHEAPRASPRRSKRFLRVRHVPRLGGARFHGSRE